MKMLGPGFTALRSASALFNILSALVLVQYANHKGLGWRSCFAVFIWAYASSFTNTSVFLSYPVALGGLLLLLTVIVPLRYEFSRYSLIFALVLGFLGFLCKLYFGFGPAFISIYFFLKQRWLLGIRFSIACILFFSLGIAAISLIFPLYFSTTVRLSVALPNWDGFHLLKQVVYFAIVFSPSLLSAVCVFYFFQQSERKKLLASFGVISTMVSAIILVKMGGNMGAYYLYFHDLLLPFISISLVDLASINRASHKIIYYGLLAGALMFLAVGAVHTPLEKIASGFEEIEELLKRKTPALVDAPASFFKISEGEYPDDPGQVRYLAFTDGLPYKLYKDQEQKISEAKAERKYEIILTDDLEVDKQNLILSSCYFKSGHVWLLLYKQRVSVDAWSPRPICVK